MANIGHLDTPGHDPAEQVGVLAIRIAMSQKRSRPNLSLSSTNRLFCPHCDQNLALTTVKKHKKLFLRSDGSWERADKDKEASGSELEGKAWTKSKGST